MKKGKICLWGALGLILIGGAGAVGANPRYLEELCIGGGYGETSDGGAELSKDGAVRMDGSLIVGGHAAADRSVAVTAGPGRNARLELHEEGVACGGAVWRDGATDSLRMGMYEDGAWRSLLELSADAQAYLSGELEAQGEVVSARNLRGVSTERLLALWHLESAASCADWASNGHTLSAGGQAMSLGDGKFGACLVGNGAGWLAANTVLPATQGNQDITLCVWVKTSETSGRLGAMGWRNSGGSLCCALYLEAGRPVFHVKGSGGESILTGANAISDGKWHYLSGVRDYEVSLTLYCDGLAVASGPDPAGNACVSSPFCLGAFGAGDGLFSGCLDEASFWGKAVCGEEIRAMSAARGELSSEYAGVMTSGRIYAEGDAFIRGGDAEIGAEGVQRGTVTCHRGANSAAPGCVRLYSPGGTAWHLFVTDSGIVRVSPSPPSGNNDGYAVGGQS